MIRQGTFVAIHNKNGRIHGVTEKFGIVRVEMSAGRFELWHIRSRYAWDARTAERIVEKSVFAIVKRYGRRSVRCGRDLRLVDVLFVMRSLVASTDWRESKDELAGQVALLHGLDVGTTKEEDFTWK